MLWAYRDGGHVDMAEKHVAIMLNNETLQVANDNSALRRLNHFECLAPNMVFSPVRLPRRNLEQHIVFEDVHIGGAGNLGGNPLWQKARDCDGEPAS